MADKINYRKAYWQHGQNLSSETDTKGNFTGNCPFCEKEKHFKVSEEDGRFQCFRCGEKGNLYTFLRKLLDIALENTDKEDYVKLKQIRNGIKWTYAKRNKYAINPLNGKWMIPYFNVEGKITNMGIWCPVEQGGVLKTHGCTLRFLGLDKVKPEGPLIIGEGDWDFLSIQWLYEEAGFKEPYSVLSTPGANTFPMDNSNIDFSRRDVVLLYDHDSAGKNGMVSAANKLLNNKQQPLSIKMVRWPDASASGYDMRDFAFTNEKRPKKAFKELQAMLEDYQTSGIRTIKRVRRTTFDEVVKDFRAANILVNKDFRDALLVCLATAFSVRIPGDPIWLLLVAPPSSGKTTLLESFLGTDQYCRAISKFTSQTLISGMKGKDGEDLSLLPELNGKIVVIKDYTTIKRLPITTQEELYGILRDIYDGHTCVIYGNGTRREFSDISFSIIAGVTDIIHGDNKATLGERFLKLNLLGESFDHDALIDAALDGSQHKAERMDAIQRSVLGFLDNPVDLNRVPEFPTFYRNKLKALAQIVAGLRATVTRNKGALAFRPRAELAPRLAVQLERLGKCVAFVLGKEVVDKEAYRLVEKVALDSATEFNLELVQHLANSKIPLTAETLADKVFLTSRAVRSNLEDLRELRLVDYSRASNNTGGGRNMRLWKLAEPLQLLWDQAFHKSSEAKTIRKKRRIAHG